MPKPVVKIVWSHASDPATRQIAKEIIGQFGRVLPRVVAAESDPLAVQRILSSEALLELRADCAGAIRARGKRRVAGNGNGAGRRHKEAEVGE